MLIRHSDIASSEITDKSQYLNRRQFLSTVGIATVAGAAGLLSSETLAASTGAVHGKKLANVVKRSQKESRQFIFTTHNPNVAVGADAELNIVLDAGADRGSIKAAGGVDDKNTNKLLVLHLEGGPEAMKRRVQKYRP